VRCLEDHRVGRDQAAQIDRIAGGRRGDARLLGLRLVKERERPAARPAAEDDALVPPALLCMAEIRAEIEHDLLHDERRVVLGEAAAGAEDVHPLAGDLEAHQCMCAPPSTTSVWPVMKSLSEEAKNATAPTRSSGRCMRCSARVDAAAWRYLIRASSAFSSESVLPGAMQLTQ